MTRRRNPAWIVAAIGLGSALGAGLLYLVAMGGGLAWLGTTNRGEFVQPAARLEDYGVYERGSDAPLAMGGTWWLVMVTDTCDAGCGATLADLRALHVLLNRDAGRLQRGLVTRDAPDARRVETHAGLVLLGAEVGTLAEGVYIVDPLGNLVLRYPRAAVAGEVLEDLKRLLKVSRIG